MSFDVSIKIKAESQLEAAKQAEAQLQALAKAGKDAGAGAGAAVTGLGKTDGALKKLTPLITVAAGELGGMSAGASILSRGLSGLIAGGFTPIGVAISAALIAGGLFQDYLRDTAAEAEKAKEKLKLFNDAMAASKSIQSDIRLSAKADAATTDFERVAVQQEKVRQQLVESFGKLLTDERFSLEQQAALRQERNQRLAELDAAGAAQSTRAKIRDAEAVAKERQGLIDQVGALITQRQALGASADQMIRLNAATQRNALANNEAAQKHDDVRKSILAEINAVEALQRAHLQFTTGQEAFGRSEQRSGVQFGETGQLEALRLAKDFGAVYNAKKGDPNAAAALNADFKSTVEKLVAMGAADIPELLTSKLGGDLGHNNLARLSSDLSRTQVGVQEVSETFDVWQQNAFGGMEKIGEEVRGRLVPVFGSGLVASMDKTRQAGEQWGQSLIDNLEKSAKQAGIAGASVRDLENELSSLNQRVKQGMAMNMDVSQPLTALDTVQQRIDLLRATPPIIINTQIVASGSPTLPFSQYFDTYMPGKIAGIGDITPEIAVNIPDYSKRVREIQDLTNQVTAWQQTAANKTGFHFEAYNAAFAEGQIKKLSPQLQDLQFNLAADVYRQQQQAAPSGSSGGGGNSGGGVAGDVTVNIYIQGGVTQEVLDRELLPKFEGVIKRATGKSPDYRVLN